jgi:hypothetical protein
MTVGRPRLLQSTITSLLFIPAGGISWRTVGPWCSNVSVYHGGAKLPLACAFVLFSSYEEKITKFNTKY